MKKQTLLGITFHFENFNHSFGRNVLSHLLREKFDLFHLLHGDTSEKLTVHAFKLSFPSTTNIQIMMIDRVDESEHVCVQKFVITKLF